MDHRCLYGHRVPESFAFAIENRTCPTCGAPTITLDGYKLARRLATEIPLEAVQAFKAAALLEEAYVLTPREEAADADTNPKVEVPRIVVTPPPPIAPAEEAPAVADAPDTAELSMAEIELDADEIERTGESEAAGINPAESLVERAFFETAPGI
jgi:hypothetical protein